MQVMLEKNEVSCKVFKNFPYFHSMINDRAGARTSPSNVFHKYVHKTKGDGDKLHSNTSAEGEKMPEY